MARHFYTGIALLLTTLWSCSTGTDPGPCEEVECRTIVYYMEAHRWDGGIDSLDPTLDVAAAFRENDGGVDQVRIPDLGAPMNRVEFNGTSLWPDDSFVYRYDPPPTGSRLQLMPPGDSNRWVVDPIYGDSLVFSFATPEMPARLTLSPPYPSDTISADSDLQISWPPSSSDPDVRNIFLASIRIRGMNGGVRQAFLDTGIEFIGLTAFTPLDQVSIPADTLEAWASDAEEVEILLLLEHYRMQDHRLGEGRWARTLFVDAENRRLILRPE